jgi:hypothetical protein
MYDDVVLISFIKMNAIRARAPHHIFVYARFLRALFPQRRMTPTDILPCNVGGCDHAAGEASFKKKASHENRRTGARRCRVDFFPGGKRICIGGADSRRTTDAEPCTGSGDHAR